MNLKIPSQKIVRSMLEGETRLFALGHSRPKGKQLSGQLAVTSIQARVGGKYTQHNVLLVDPKNCETTKALLVTCLEEASVPKRRRGRKPNDK